MSILRVSGEGWGLYPGRSPSCRQNDRRFWKHYLPTTSLAGSNKKIFLVDACRPLVNQMCFGGHQITVLMGVPCLMPKGRSCTVRSNASRVIWGPPPPGQNDGHYLPSTSLVGGNNDVFHVLMIFWVCGLRSSSSGRVGGESKKESVCLFPLEMNNRIPELFEEEPIKKLPIG